MCRFLIARRQGLTFGINKIEFVFPPPETCLANDYGIWLIMIIIDMEVLDSLFMQISIYRT